MPWSASELKGVLSTHFCLSEKLQLLSVPCYIEGGNAILCILASCWFVPHRFPQGIPVAQRHPWTAEWCKAAQGHWTTTASHASKRKYPLSLWITFGWYSAQEVHPSEGEWLESMDNSEITCSTSFLSNYFLRHLIQKFVFFKGTSKSRSVWVSPSAAAQH